LIRTADVSDGIGDGVAATTCSVANTAFGKKSWEEENDEARDEDEPAHDGCLGTDLEHQSIEEV